MMRRVLAIAAFACLACGGCAAPVVEQEHADFISDYSTLVRVNDSAYRYTSPSIRHYSKFLIEAPTILFERTVPVEQRHFSDVEIDDLKEYFRARLETALTIDDGFTIVSEPGEGVARIRVAITAIDASVGALNVAIYTKVTGAGLGGAAMEGEIVDSLTGEQLAAAVQWGNGSRVLRAGLSKLGDAKLQINRWAKNLRQRIDSAHEQST